jgi:hypothetical protein
MENVANSRSSKAVFYESKKFWRYLNLFDYRQNNAINSLLRGFCSNMCMYVCVCARELLIGMQKKIGIWHNRME